MPKEMVISIAELRVALLIARAEVQANEALAMYAAAKANYANAGQIQQLIQHLKGMAA